MIVSRSHYQLSLPHKTLVLGKHTLIMGVLNITPDSFSDGGKFFSLAKAVDRALELESQGANILDIGGESSRPGAETITLDEELERVIPVIEALSGKIKIPISIDTYKSEVARQAIKAGAEIVNDISAFRLDQEMPKVILETGAAICLMHMRGNPKIMQKLPPSNDIWQEIEDYFSLTIKEIQDIGISLDKIIIDPGIGFGKTTLDNCKILAEQSRLTKFNLPVLIGTSRKSFIGAILNKNTEDRLMGTAATVTTAILQGAHIVRVHDVAEMVEIARVTDAILNAINL
jgi:dihydropteroate synthase